MRIRDWSSDVCSSDLAALALELLAIPRHSYATRGIEPARGMRDDYLTDTPEGFRFRVFDREGQPCPACGGLIRSEERRVGKSVSVRVDLGGRRIIKKKKPQPHIIRPTTHI